MIIIALAYLRFTKFVLSILLIVSGNDEETNDNLPTSEYVFSFGKLTKWEEKKKITEQVKNEKSNEV